jgi:5,10-methylenetetrahydromethanopterin reductase
MNREVPRDARHLGAYILPGRAPDPLPMFAQVRAAEEIGLGAVWLSERLGTKDAPVLFGALTQVTSSVRLGTAAMHFQNRHPLVLASTAATLQLLSGGRFIFGVGKLARGLWEQYGLPDATNRLLSDTLDIVRRLLAGETVTYDGIAGNFPSLKLIDVPDVSPPPFLLTAVGPRTLDVAGRYFDGVLLHPFLTTAAVTRSVERVRAAALAAGRDPLSVRTYYPVVVAADLPPEEEASRVRARAVTYFQSDPLGPAIVAANDWSSEPLGRLRNHPLVVALAGSYADFGLTKQEQAEVGSTIPDEWLHDGAAVGSTEQCAARLHEYLDAGADELIIHGSTPDMLGPVVDAFQRIAAPSGLGE